MTNTTYTYTPEDAAYSCSYCWTWHNGECHGDFCADCEDFVPAERCSVCGEFYPKEEHHEN